MKEKMQKGFISMIPIRSEYRKLEFKEKTPEPQPEEFNSFTLSLLGSIGSPLDETRKEPGSLTGR